MTITQVTLKVVKYQGRERRVAFLFEEQNPELDMPIASIFSSEFDTFAIERGISIVDIEAILDLPSSSIKVSLFDDIKDKHYFKTIQLRSDTIDKALEGLTKTNLELNSKMTLSEFIDKIRSDTIEFQCHWDSGQIEFGEERFPENMSEADWFDQFIAFLEITADSQAETEDKSGN